MNIPAHEIAPFTDAELEGIIAEARAAKDSDGVARALLRPVVARIVAATIAAALQELKLTPADRSPANTP